MGERTLQGMGNLFFPTFDAYYLNMLYRFPPPPAEAKDVSFLTGKSETYAKLKIESKTGKRTVLMTEHTLIFVMKGVKLLHFADGTLRISPGLGRDGTEVAGGFVGLETLGVARAVLLEFDSPAEPPQPAARITAAAIVEVTTMCTPRLIIFHPSFRIAGLTVSFMALRPRPSPTPTGKASAAKCTRPDTSRSETSRRSREYVRGRPFRCAPIHRDWQRWRAR